MKSGEGRKEAVGSPEQSRWWDLNRWACLFALHFPLSIRFPGIWHLGALRGWRQGTATGVGGPSLGRGEGMAWARRHDGMEAMQLSGSRRLSAKLCSWRDAWACCTPLPFSGPREPGRLGLALALQGPRAQTQREVSRVLDKRVL